MADKSLDILIKTEAELQGAEAAAQSLERQIGKAKVLGENFKALESQLENVRASISEYKAAQEEAAHVDDEAGKKTEFLNLRKQELKKLVRELSQEFPLLGRALNFAMNPMIASITIVIGLFALAKRHLDDWNRALDEMGERARLPLGDMKAAIFEATDAVAESKRQLDNWRASLTNTIQAQKNLFDQAVTRVNLQLDATRQLMAAEKELALQEVATQQALGKISAEEATLRRSKIEQFSESAGNALSSRAGQEELKLRREQRANLAGNLGLMERQEREFEAAELNAKQRAVEINRGKTIPQLRDELKRLEEGKAEDTPDGLRKAQAELEKTQRYYGNNNEAVGRGRDDVNPQNPYFEELAQRKAAVEAVRNQIEQIKNGIEAMQRQANAVKEVEEEHKKHREKIKETTAQLKDLDVVIKGLEDKVAIADKTNKAVEGIHGQTAAQKMQEDIFSSPLGNMFMLAAQGQTIAEFNKRSLPQNRIALTGDQASAMTGAQSALNQAAGYEETLAKGGKLTQEQSLFLRRIIALLSGLDDGQRRAVEALSLTHDNSVRNFQRISLLEREVAALNKQLRASQSRLQGSYLP